MSQQAPPASTTTSTSVIINNVTPRHPLGSGNAMTHALAQGPPGSVSANLPSFTLKQRATAAELPISFDDEEEEGSVQEPSVTPLLSLKNLIVVTPIILTPVLYGYNLGFVGPYSTMYEYASNCQLYKTKTSCETVTAANCLWFNAATLVSDTPYGEVCGWSDKTTCFLRYKNELSCSSDTACKWSYSDNTCGNHVGYSSIQSGLFAGSLVIGSTFGALMGGYLTKRLDYRKSFLIVGLISVIGNALTHIATGLFQYWLLLVARIVLGFPLGWQSIATPHYTDKFAPTGHAKTLGTLFQVSVSTGIFITACFGLALGNTIGYDADSNANAMGRMQGLVAVSTLLSALILFLPLITTDGYSKSKRGDYEEENAEVASKRAAEEKYSMTQMIGPMLNGVAMACVAQLTGINANMNFAPTIMSNLGLQPLVGNIVVMTWNMLATFCVIPLSRRFSMRSLFLFCGFLGSLFCVFFGGVPVYPGVTKSDKVVSGVAITGIAIFIALYEMGVGPCFYVLAVDVFPESFRSIGSSITVGVMFIFNLIINICYPIATEGISGGPSGNPNKGQAVAFIFFGCIGVVACVIEYVFLQPWEVLRSEGTDTVHEAAVREDNATEAT
ncbi:hypothetical protein JKF63_02044 [Porcisia hertigi]|uniref:Major facilitator superfamily (MFS) profile domain-containing protein n=1 Tax=Porcisia hertigi TaxID=2761500 RepID=A0A836L2N5_9TRYP|nr:hypothetical protein JKF63_02044 [Porcisia hertigi]